MPRVVCGRVEIVEVNSVLCTLSRQFVGNRLIYAEIPMQGPQNSGKGEGPLLGSKPFGSTIQVENGRSRATFQEEQEIHWLEKVLQKNLLVAFSDNGRIPSHA